MNYENELTKLKNINQSIERKKAEIKALNEKAEKLQSKILLEFIEKSGLGMEEVVEVLADYTGKPLEAPESAESKPTYQYKEAVV